MIQYHGGSDNQIMNNSILDDIKSLCGIPVEVKDFDNAIILHCNSVFSTLTQLGLGPNTGFFITDDTWTWIDLIENQVNLHNVKSYVYLKVKLLFDPPANATLISSMNEQIAEFEWRIRTELETVTRGGA